MELKAIEILKVKGYAELIGDMGAFHNEINEALAELKAKDEENSKLKERIAELESVRQAKGLTMESKALKNCVEPIGQGIQKNYTEPKKLRRAKKTTQSQKNYTEPKKLHRAKKTA